MRQINLEVRSDGTAGAIIPQAAIFVAELRPSAQIDGDIVITQEPIVVELDAGVPEDPIILRSLPAGYWWNIRLRRANGVSIVTRDVVFPAGTAPIDFADLIDIDPAVSMSTPLPSTWQIATAQLTERVLILEQVEHVGGAVGFVEVITGNEPRPADPFVIWKGGTTTPVNMAPIDIHFALTEAPVDTTSPTTPTGLAATNITSNGFTLTWIPPFDATGYEVEVTGQTAIATSATSLVLSGLVTAATWDVRIRARDAAANWSAWSLPFTVTAPVVDPPAEPNLITVFGDGVGGTPTKYNDGGTLRVLNAFYVYGGRVGWQAVGARIFIPEGATVPTTATAYLYAPTPPGEADVLIAATAPITATFTNLAAGWNEVMFATSHELTSGVPVYVGYQFPDGSYIHTTLATLDPTVSVPPGVALAAPLEAVAGSGGWPRSMFSANGGPLGASSGAPSYGIDIIVESV